MKHVLLMAALLATVCLGAQPAKNIFIITIDGLRWQEVFKGADTVLLQDSRFVTDTTLLSELYNDRTADLRRQKLMPFFWNVIAKKGQLSGNRSFGNKVDVSNIYKISYPGYNEILTGYADPRPVFNTPTPNRNITILEHLNNDKEYTGKIAAFSSWNIFPYILNTARSGIVVNSGYESVAENDSTDRFINQVQENVSEKSHCRYDQLTYLAARNYIQTNHPRVVLIGLGETDEFAHQKKYDNYLQQANAIDKMISDLWYYVQTDDFYRNQTTFIITSDHGRGSKRSAWYAHNLFVKGSGETWQAMLGPGIPALGEMKEDQQVYQKQIAGRVAVLLGRSLEKDRLTINRAVPDLVTAAIPVTIHGTVSVTSATEK